MDKNKLKVLQDLDYSIKRTCGNCYHGAFNSMSFGVCLIHKYEHQKHTTEKRQLSVNQYGYCAEHKWKNPFVNFIHGFAEFMEK